MATVPVTRTWVAGEVVTAAYMNNNISDVCNWLLAPAMCQVRQIVAQSLASGSYTALTFTAEDVDSTGMHSNVSNPSRLTAVYPGWYLDSAAVSYASDATQRRGGQWWVNGAAVNAGGTLVFAGLAAALVIPSRTLLTYLNVGDYLEYRAFNGAAGALLTLVTASEQSSVTTTWMSN